MKLTKPIICETVNGTEIEIWEKLLPDVFSVQVHTKGGLFMTLAALEDLILTKEQKIELGVIV